MRRRRIEKLEAHMPVPAGKLMERLERQAMNSLSAHDRALVSEMRQVTGRRRKAWSQEHESAEARHLEAVGVLMQEVSDEDLAGMIAQVEREFGRPIPDCEAIS